MSDLSAHETWNQAGGPRYPHEKVVQFCLRNFRDGQRRIRALDLGSGGGVHTVFLAREGFHVVAVEPSPSGAEHTRAWLGREGLQAEVLVQTFENIDLPPASIDLVVCMEVVQCMEPVAVARGLDRLSRVLTADAQGFFQFASDEDSIHRGSPLGLRGYSNAEVRDLFGSRFRDVNCDRYITTYKNGAIVQNEWLITFRGVRESA